MIDGNRSRVFIYAGDLISIITFENLILAQPHAQCSGAFYSAADLSKRTNISLTN
jgi:hypothetical protein